MLIARGDPEVWRVTGVSLQLSVLALLLAMVVGVPTGYLMAGRVSSANSMRRPSDRLAADPMLRHHVHRVVQELRSLAANPRLREITTSLPTGSAANLQRTSRGPRCVQIASAMSA
jgi:hypothetical protein